MRTNNVALRTCTNFRMSSCTSGKWGPGLPATLLRANRPVLIGPRHVAVHQGATEVSRASGLPSTVKLALIRSLFRQLPCLEGNCTSTSALFPSGHSLQRCNEISFQADQHS